MTLHYFLFFYRCLFIDKSYQDDILKRNNRRPIYKILEPQLKISIDRKIRILEHVLLWNIIPRIS